MLKAEGKTSWLSLYVGMDFVVCRKAMLCYLREALNFILLFRRVVRVELQVNNAGRRKAYNAIEFVWGDAATKRRNKDAIFGMLVSHQMIQPMAWIRKKDQG